MKRPIGLEEKLERPRVPIADRRTRALDGALHRLTCRVVESRRRRLFDQLLVPALDRALALAEREHTSLGVAEHLDLDVAGGDECLLEVERPVAEGGVGLGTRGGERTLELVLGEDRTHPLAATSGGRLEQDREPELVGDRPDLGQVDRPVGAGDERHSRRAQLFFRTHLVPHPLHHVRGWPDEDDPRLLARADEGGVLGEKAVAGMQRLAAGRLGCRDDARDAQVALGGRGRADADRVISELEMVGVPIGRRVDGDRLDAKLVQGTDDPDGDLAPVRDEDS